MIHLPKRYFFQARNQKHYKKRGKKMGGPEYRILTPEEIASYTNVDGASNIPSVQEAIDGLNAAIDRLDKIINEMGQTNGNTN